MSAGRDGQPASAPASKAASKSSSKAASKSVARCPICRAPTVKAHRPFCSKRCATLDLGRWLKGAYAVPGDPADAAYPEAPAGSDED